MRECPVCLCCFDDKVTRCPADGQATFNSLAGGLAIGRYVLERRLGQGGMGVVYKAQHIFLKSPSAIKVINPDLVGNDPSVATRFRQEAMAAAAIRHPNIIHVTDYGLLNDTVPFIVMEFVEGESLQAVMSAQGKFSPEKALEYMTPIASGVAAAHRQGIVHRDLKPLNIMIQPNRTIRDGLKILDFGLAKIKSGELLGSFSGAKTTGIIGSPYYMAPEQWSDEEPDKRCDVYSLGVILHQMLTGEVPFKGSAIPAVMKKHLMAPVPPLANAKQGISKELEQVVHLALEKDPKDRTATAEDLLAGLEKAVLQGASASKTRRRTRAKPKTAATRPEKRVAGRVTGEQEQAKQEEAVVTRQTGDQERAFRTTELESQALEEETNLNLKKESEQENYAIENISASEAEKFRIEEEHTQKDEEAIVQSQESWRRAAEAARLRAAERALRESGDKGDSPPADFIRPTIPSDPRETSPGRSLSSKMPTWSISYKRKYLIGAGVALGICVFGLYILAKTWHKSEELAKGPDEVPAVVGRDMVFIEGGTFTMGRVKGTVLDSPPHTVVVKSFYIDKTEVTNSEYAIFLKATGNMAPPINHGRDSSSDWKPWNGYDYPVGEGQWPVRNVSVKEAEAFAQWLSERDGVKYRLPSEEEWEYAARNGSATTLFPWGDSWVGGRANINETGSPKPVSSFPNGATQSGLQDMVGNVWEWTSSKASYYDPQKQVPTEELSAHIRRGCSYATPVEMNFSPATDRAWMRDERHKTIGFRLARDAR